MSQQYASRRRSLDHGRVGGGVMRAQIAGQRARPQLLFRPTLEETGRFCDVYETFLVLCPGALISFEHGQRVPTGTLTRSTKSSFLAFDSAMKAHS